MTKSKNAHENKKTIHSHVQNLFLETTLYRHEYIYYILELKSFGVLGLKCYGANYDYR